MAALWTDFFKYVIPELPGVPTSITRDRIREAAIELCRLGVIQEDIPVLQTLAHTQTYTMASANANQKPYRIESMFIDGTQVYAKTKDELDLLYPTWKTDEQPGSFVGYTQDDETHFSLVWIPSATGAAGNIKIRARVVPKPDSVDGDQRLLDDWHEAIANHAKYCLMGMVNVKWSNAAGSATYYRRWMKKRGDAIWAVARQRSRNDLLVTPYVKFGER
jgi:hypothetical protein